jgi:hypothetical protein
METMLEDINSTHFAFPGKRGIEVHGKYASTCLPAASIDNGDFAPTDRWGRARLSLPVAF